VREERKKEKILCVCEEEKGEIEGRIGGIIWMRMM
jgi:hypothetical protein